MEVVATADRDADAIAVGLFEGGSVSGPGAALVESGEARGKARHTALTHADGRRWIVVGLGARDDWGPEAARVAGAVALARARDAGARSLAWELPNGTGPAEAAALVEGSALASYRFDRYKRGEDEDDRRSVERLDVDAPAEVVHRATVVAEAQNAARDLQNTPSNDMTPTRLADRARELAGSLDGLAVEVEGRAGIEGHGMGAFAAVARGADEEPALITLRYDGPSAAGPVLGFVGKAVTFDTGGISIKPAAKMHEMKFDMSGGAAVLEAVGAIARLALPVRLVAVIGATENMPSGHAMKPGDIVRAMNGTTIEINNTDAEGRLVLADCLAWAIEQGAERVVDLATLTGAIVVALGSTYAGLFSADDEWAEAVEAAARESGELVWRFPFHPEYAKLIEGAYADVSNAPEARKAMSIAAAEFLKRFTGDVPWAHIDIAGTAWDVDRPYTPKGGSGYGVRLLVELARAQAGITAK
ncbi:MAG: leucyl aminopeptidase [Solirubrobacteraceae bacterium]|jgi:leucyl aminopeptidase|nr:leucyl aminopeptidase [Solirubrobacteraceae bacterium]